MSKRFAVDSNGEVNIFSNEMGAVDAQSPLARVALHDGQKSVSEAIYALVGKDEEEQARMSATSYWLALRVVNGKTRILRWSNNSVVSRCD